MSQSQADDKLAAARRVIAEDEAKTRAAHDAAVADKRGRDAQVEQARGELAELRTQLFSRLEQVPRSNNRTDTSAAGVGVIKFGNALAGPARPVHKWDIVAWAPIEAVCKAPPCRWASTLIFADLGDGNAYRWYEISFYEQLSASRRDAPFAVDPHQPEFREAISMLARTMVAFGPRTISGDAGRAEFIERWTDRFADAIVGKLARPRSLPLQ